MTDNAGGLTVTGQKDVSYDIIRYLDRHPDLLPLVVDLSVQWKAAIALGRDIGARRRTNRRNP